MKEIIPFNIYVNGQNVQVNYLSLYCVGDNLVDSATFNYGLYFMDKTAEFQIPNLLNQGQLTLSGTDYVSGWNTNDDAWNWAAQKMNIVFV